MSLKGSAFLALWNDIEAAREAEYNLWHTREHVPERVSIPGILSGRRYVAHDATLHRYFTLYELEAAAVLSSAAYRKVVDGPTSWSRSMRPSFRNFLRYPCETRLSLGQGLGGVLATLRFGAARLGDPRAVIERLFDIEAVTGLHLGAADLSEPFPLQTGPTESGLRYVLIVEANDRSGLSAALPMIRAALGTLGSQGPIDDQLYELVYAVTRHDLGDVPAPFKQPNR
jgi:hypothetical protein